MCFYFKRLEREILLIIALVFPHIEYNCNFPLQCQQVGTDLLQGYCSKEWKDYLEKK